MLFIAIFIKHLSKRLIFSWCHEYVEVIVPGNKSTMPFCSKCRTAHQAVVYIVLYTKLVYISGNIQDYILKLLEFIRIFSVLSH